MADLPVLDAVNPEVIPAKTAAMAGIMAYITELGVENEVITPPTT